MKQRPLKPEFWTDELVASLPPGARLLYACCFNLADDAGNLPGNPRFLWHQAFGYDESTSLKDAEKWRRQLVKVKRLIEYKVKGQVYLHGPTFVGHFGVAEKRRFYRYPPMKNRKKTRTSKDDAVPEQDTDTTQAGHKHCGSGSGSGSGSGLGSGDGKKKNPLKPPSGGQADTPDGSNGRKPRKLRPRSQEYHMQAKWTPDASGEAAIDRDLADPSRRPIALNLLRIAAGNGAAWAQRRLDQEEGR